MGSDSRGAEEFERLVSEAMKRCQARGETPAVWSAEVASCVVSLGLELPNAELGEVVVSHLSSNFGEPSLWKFLDHAMASRLISSLHALCLLTPRVLSCRQAQPEAFRLYLDLLARYTFSLEDVPSTSKASREKILRAIDANLQVSRTYGINVGELGHTLVIFFFSTIVRLIDAAMDDWGLQMASMDGPSGSFGSMEHHQRDVDIRGSQGNIGSGHRECMRNMNSLIAMVVLENLTRSRKALALLRLVHMNVPDKFNGLLQRLQFLETCELLSPNLNSAKEVLTRLSSNIHKALVFESDLKRSFIGMFLDIRPIKSVPCSDSGSASSACWAPFDLYMESAMDERQLPVTPAIVTLTEQIISLQALNRASWQETFLALWLSALRLVQREHDPPESPVPHMEARLWVLLCIVPLAIAGVLMDDINLSCTSFCDPSAHVLSDPGHGHRIDEKLLGLRRNGLVSSLQLLGQFSGLLHPPVLVQDAANRAAAKAAKSSSEKMKGNDSVGVGDHDVLLKCGGNMRHLIVEACIARGLIDTSAYFWPSYVPTSVVSIADSPMKEMSPWSAFMEGSALIASLISSLVATPATSFAEIEKLYYVALNGSNEEKQAAARIMCGASLRRGWNIQEHVVKFVVKLLSPPVPAGHNGPQSHFVDYMPMLSAVLFGASSVDTVHILSLHGVVPEVAAALIPLCEVFGSLNPLLSSEFRTSEEPSVYMVFSAAFLFLLRLWKFYKPPIEGAIGADLTLEYLMLLHNSRRSLASHDSAPQNEVNSNMSHASTSDEPVYIDNYSRFRAWYCQNKICLDSPLSGLHSGSPVHEVANKILRMIYWKMTGSASSSGNSSTPTTKSTMGGSPPSAGEEPYERPVLCAWEVLEAIPFVLEAILTACAYGRLSSRDLTTGLRDLVDFLPASLGTIISYFTAEVTRGIWRPVQMNGIDWPSPTQTIHSVESEIIEILAAAGVNKPIYYPSGVVPMLPLPMAALVSLTITFKLDKSLEYIQAVVGPAMESCASYCPWPCMAIIGSLWAQKIRRWHDFIVVACTRSVFRTNKEALTQLIRSCFASFLGPVDDLNHLLTKRPCLNGLLGNKISAFGVPPSIAPGFLYLRSCRSIQDKQYLVDTIIGLVVEYSSKLATRCAEACSARLKSGQASLSLAAARIKEVALLGASLLCSAGGAQLAQQMLLDTIPTWLLTIREEKDVEGSFASRMFKGYGMAYFVYVTGAFTCGIRVRAAPSPYSRRSHIIGMHMDFLAGMLARNVSLGCDPVTLKSYISCLVGLVVGFAPVWVREVKHETLGRLARGLWGWHECELALSLLERGGFAAMGPLSEFFSVID